jgi:adenylosuccinate lyase
VIYPENMLKNMNKFKGLVMSQRVLLALTQAGVSREDAYRLVQRNAMKVWEKGRRFQDRASGRSPRSPAALSPAEIEEKFDLGYHTKHVDTIFAGSSAFRWRESRRHSVRFRRRHGAFCRRRKRRRSSCAIC